MNTKQQILLQMATRMDRIVAARNQFAKAATKGEATHAIAVLQNQCNLLKINADNLGTWFVENSKGGNKK